MRKCTTRPPNKEVLEESAGKQVAYRNQTLESESFPDVDSSLILPLQING